MSEKLSLTFPGGLVTKTKINDFTFLTDYPEDRGGKNLAVNPWNVFLAAILTCQGVNLAKYCLQHDVDYSQVKIELIPLVEDTRRQEDPEYQLRVDLPEDFPQDHIQPMVDFFTDCPVANHLTELKPVLTTYINGDLVSRKIRK